MQRLKKLQNLTFNFKDIKVTRLQGCKGCKIRLFSFDPIKLGKSGGGERGEIITSALNCNQLLNISKMVQLIFAKLVSHFRQLNRVLSKWQVFLGFSSDSEIGFSSDSEIQMMVKLGTNISWL